MFFVFGKVPSFDAFAATVSTRNHSKWALACLMFFDISRREHFFASDATLLLTVGTLTFQMDLAVTCSNFHAASGRTPHEAPLAASQFVIFKFIDRDLVAALPVTFNQTTFALILHVVNIHVSLNIFAAIPFAGDFTFRAGFCFVITYPLSTHFPSTTMDATNHSFCAVEFLSVVNV